MLQRATSVVDRSTDEAFEGCVETLRPSRMTTGRSPPADRFEAAKALQAEIAPCATTRAFLHEGKSLTIASVGNSAATHVRTLRPGCCPSPCNSFRHRS